MKNILIIDSSPSGANSFSRKLSEAVGQKLKAKNPGAVIFHHDLSKIPTPHLEESHLEAFFTPVEKYSEKQKVAISHSDKAIDEIMKADAIIIGVPMYNFSVPSVLKSWIDQICRAGKTFKYGANGPEGLVKGKKVYLAIASGGVYSDGPMKAYDFTEPYLKTVLGFLGMTDVKTFRVEGVAIPEVKETALEKATSSIHI